MGESELIGMIRDVNAQYAVLFGQIITINFAMIVAIYYFPVTVVGFMLF